MLTGIGGGGGGMTAPMHRKKFKAMDTNGDGSLDKSELAGMAKRTGKSVDDLMTALDANKDGKVDPQEMQAAAKRRHAQQAQGAGDTGNTSDVKAAASQFTSALMNLMKQLHGNKAEGSGQSGNANDGDADDSAPATPGAAAAAGLTGASGQGALPSSQGGAASEFTTALMNLFKQLGVDQGSGSATGNSSATGTTAAAPQAIA